MPVSSILIAYFSHSGNTTVIADQVHDCCGGDLFEIESVDPYPEDYDAVVAVAGREQKARSRPKLTGRVKDMAPYEAVVLGYPNWWGTMPMAVFSFLESYDLSGKKIAPFCTHEGSGLGRSAQDLAALLPRSTILEGLAVRGSKAAAARKDVSAWLRRIGLTE